ncbi:MAG: hypothetical protein HYR56_05415 [Acidobacteria bacterium]|nr:hypothetical protein [Acidobacteriota bacterium]MBI3422215.1 hypothetical protein [Acidobacteriota bacterium]
MSIEVESAGLPAVLPSATELLHTWWWAGETEQAEQLLTRLLAEHATPTIKAVIAFRLRTELTEPSDVEDVCQEATLQLLARLNQLKNSGAPPLYGDFRSYVAAIAHQVCSLYRRRQFPQRARLKDQVRYVLTHQPSLALWEAARKIWLSGFAAWRDQRQQAIAASQVQRLQDEPEKLAFPGIRLGPVVLAELLTAIFNYFRGPLEFPALVNLVATLRGIKDAPARQTLPEESAPQLRLDDQTAGRVEQRLYLQQLWQALIQLPLPQRLALLLNLRDAQERGLVMLLVELQITSLHQLAEVLEMTPTAFAELWRELPVDDTRIAALLGLTRQQVINLRSSARRQLASRLRAVQGEQ